MFDDIIGNNKIKQKLQLAIENNLVSHSYMFTGIQGIGKQLFAKEFAKQILCLNNKCNNNSKCDSCVKYETLNHPDYTFIEQIGNSIKIDKIREMQKDIQEKPILSPKKVYIINNVETMTKEAQNCLLKTLEEPPRYAIIILICQNENMMLTTIKSRCMILQFEKIPKEDILRYVKSNEDIQINEEILDVFDGSIGKILELKDKQESYLNIQKFIEQIDKNDILEILKYAKPLYETKEEIYNLLEFINIILLKKCKIDSRYSNCIMMVEETKKRLKQNSNYDMTIDNMVFSMWEDIN